MSELFWDDDKLMILHKNRQAGYTYKDTAKQVGSTYGATKKAACKYSERIDELAKRMGKEVPKKPGLVSKLKNTIKPKDRKSHVKTDSIVIPKKAGKYGYEKDIKDLKENIKKTRGITSSNGNILIIGDLHLPFQREGYLEFCMKVRDLYNCGTIVNIGDEVDNHAINFHEHDPDGYSSGHEVLIAYREMQKWIQEFPEMYLCNGNHTMLPLRKAKALGMSRAYLRTFNEIWDAPQEWQWAPSWEIDDVIYTHTAGGVSGALNKAGANRQSTVCGHAHSQSSVMWSATHRDIIFGMYVGCGIDPTAYAMEYGKELDKRPVISCGVVLDYGRQAFVVPMDI